MSKNAVRIAADLVLDLYTLEDPPVPQTDDVRRAIDMGRAAMDHALGEGADRILDRITVSVGVINGGVKINVPPGHCRLEVDIRLPIGLTHVRDHRGREVRCSLSGGQAHAGVDAFSGSQCERSQPPDDRNPAKHS
jgi:acetylornithine deacetylase/succinyl-diaminopimelate desuccinylase-like protein